VTSADRVRLLHGPHRSPSLGVGDRATCLFENCDVVVTSWTDAGISWPRCKRLNTSASRTTVALLQPPVGGTTFAFLNK
jgi:hypothetical protein